jgi:hypothetical protein
MKALPEIELDYKSNTRIFFFGGVTKEKDPLIGQAKDLAAGAVLIVSLVALVLGMIIFLPKLWLFFS